MVSLRWEGGIGKGKGGGEGKRGGGGGILRGDRGESTAHVMDQGKVKQAVAIKKVRSKKWVMGEVYG